MKKYLINIALILLLLLPLHSLFIENNFSSFVIGFYIGCLFIFPALYFKIVDSNDPNRFIKLKTYKRMVLAIALIINITLLFVELNLFDRGKLTAVCLIMIIIAINNGSLILNSFNDEKIYVYLEDEEVFIKTNRFISKWLVFGAMILIILILKFPITKYFTIIYIAYFIVIQVIGYFFAKRIYLEKYN